jgi:hypothetical protein
VKSEGKFISDGQLYPNKLPNNFYGCPVKTSVLYCGTAEVPYVIASCKLRNFTAIIQFKHKNDRFSSEAIHELFQDLLFGLSIGVTAGIPLVVEATSFESKYIWQVLCSTPLPRLLVVSGIFSASLCGNGPCSCRRVVFVHLFSWR